MLLAAIILAMPSLRVFVLSALGFVLVLVTVESLCRFYRAPLSIGEERVYLDKRRVLTSMPVPDLLILGDSAAQEDLVPAEFAGSDRHAVYNAAIPSASGIVQRALAASVSWRPAALIYAGIPVQVLDTWPLQRHERKEIQPLQRLRWPQVGGDVLLSGISELFARRIELRMALGRWFSTRGRTFDALAAPVDSGDRSGWLGQDVLPLDESALTRGAEIKIGIWFERPQVVGWVRDQQLRQALHDWSDGRTRRTLVLLPLSAPLRAMLAGRPETPIAWQRWRDAAEHADAQLFDCTAAFPDQRFHDEDHLDEIGARLLSRDLALASERGTSQLCARLH
jgi:hypothetical protein